MLTRNKIIKFSHISGVPVKQLLDVLFLMKTHGYIDNNDLVRRSGVAKSSINLFKKELSDVLKPVSSNTAIKEDVIINLKEILPDTYKPADSILDFGTSSFSHLLTVKRIEPSRKLDQFLASAATVSRRASTMDFFEDLQGKHVLFLGDDDHTSIVTAALDKAESIHVLDIDLRILNNINKIATENRLQVEEITHDLRAPLPEDYCGKFDTVFTDPPYTLAGATLFLSRAVSALDRLNKAGRIYFCYGVSDGAKERILPLYNIINRHGLMIRYVFDKFNSYEGAESIGSSSALFILETTPQTKVVIKNNYAEPIYTCN